MAIDMETAKRPFRETINSLPRWRFDDTPRFICTRHEFIFTWIPKNAGRTILNALHAEHGEHKGGGVHVPYSHLEALNPAVSDFFHFAVIRNPWDRAVSCYFNKVYVETPSTASLLRKFDGLEPGMPFSAFVDWLLSENGCDRHADQHWASQFLFLSDHEGRQFVKQLIRYENLAADLEAISDRVGISAQRLGHFNSRKKVKNHDPAYAYDPSPHHYRKYYLNDAMIEAIAKRYQNDIELFGYSF